jgi:CMP-N-acetylneuraminic acid synthetase
MKFLDEIWAVIPARSGSKSIKNKNIKKLSGKPLLAYSVLIAKRSKLIKKIIFSSDSTKYFNVAKRYGNMIFHKRSKKISQDRSTDFQIFDDLLKYLNKKNIGIPKYFVHIRPTTPLREPKQIDKAIKYFIKNKSRASALRSVHEMSETLYKAFEISNKKLLKPMFGKSKSLDKIHLPRQEFKKTYVANGIIDIYSVSFIKKNKMLLGSKVIPFIVSPTTEVDSINDFKYLEYQVKKNPKILSKMFKS